MLTDDTARDRPLLAIVIEVQLERSQDKWWTWPMYVGHLRNRLRCPVVLLVVCVDEEVARWAATPIELGNVGARLPPTVLGPDRVPLLTDPEQAVRVPELAVLSALAYRDTPHAVPVVEAMVDALTTIEPDHAKLYADLVLAALSGAARDHLRKLMSTRTHLYQSEYAQELRAEGRADGLAEGLAEGLADAVLTVLAARGVAVPADARARISACRDRSQLEEWTRRAARAESIGDVIG